MKDLKILTIRLPLGLWQKLMLMKIEGKIKSIQNIVIQKLKEVVKDES